MEINSLFCIGSVTILREGPHHSIEVLSRDADPVQKFLGGSNIHVYSQIIHYRM